MRPLGFQELVRQVLGKNGDQERGQVTVFLCLQMIWASFAPVGDDQLVDGKPFRSWHLGQET